MLYVWEKWADGPDDVHRSISDGMRFSTRRHFFGGQPCAESTMYAAWCILFMSIAVFLGWHGWIAFLIHTHKGKRDAWRTLATPESMALCGKPLPSVLTQFNGHDTAVAKAHSLLSKWVHHRHSVSADERAGDSGVAPSSKAAALSNNNNKYAVDPSVSPLVQRHSFHGEL